MWFFFSVENQLSDSSTQWKSYRFSENNASPSQRRYTSICLHEDSHIFWILILKFWMLALKWFCYPQILQDHCASINNSHGSRRESSEHRPTAKPSPRVEKVTWSKGTSRLKRSLSVGYDHRERCFKQHLLIIWNKTIHREKNVRLL